MSEFLTLEKFRELELKLIKNSKFNLINKAGNAVNSWIKQKFPIQNKIIILIGKGNNGADGINSAIKLLKSGFSVTLLLVMKDLNQQSLELLQNFKNQHGKILNQIPSNFLAYDIIIDAILGIGLNVALSQALQKLIAKVNLSNKIIISLDTPTGLEPFSGEIYGSSVKATYTITFIVDKPGFHTGIALDFTGEIIVAPLIRPKDFLENGFNSGSGIAINKLSSINYTILKRIDKNTNKGKFGTTAIIGGANGMQGALYLAGRAAMLLGSGKVVLGFLDKDFAPDYLMPELITKNAKDIINNLAIYTTLVIGPGLGNSNKAIKILTQLIEQKPSRCNLIFDADALNILAKTPKLIKSFKILPNKIITPHPLEASRLLNTHIDEIEKNRFNAINKLFREYNAVTLLKGAGSLIKYEDDTFINETGNVGLSTAGSGDVLCGLIGAFASQGMELSHALRFGVYLHGLSADILAQNLAGTNGILASELAYAARNILNKLLYI